MIEILLTVVPSILWILYRCYKIINAPVEKLVKDLNIEIPNVPRICVDSITKSSIIMHWDVSPNRAEILYYIVYVNNMEGKLIHISFCCSNINIF